MSKAKRYERIGRSISRDGKAFITITRTDAGFSNMPASPAEVDYLTQEIAKFLNANADRLASGYRAYLNSEVTK